MDLILLQPGDPSFLGGITPAYGGRPIDSPLGDSGLTPGQCVELVSLQQGMKQQVATDVSISARTSGRPILTDFTCVKYTDASSMRLYDYCLRAKPLGTGKDQPTILCILRNSGESTANVITFCLRDALVSAVQFQTHPDDMPTEQFALNFTEILWSYTVPTAGRLSAGWSLLKNRPIASFTD